MRSLLPIVFLIVSQGLSNGEGLFNGEGLLISTANAQTPPPALGEETKGEPAIDETIPYEGVDNSDDTSAHPETHVANDEQAEESDSPGILGEATITESRRENGQVYLIELEHSSGTKLYLEENDSDGKIDAPDNDLEAEPNIPKWRLGKW